jgi:hypothetical protein
LKTRGTILLSEKAEKTGLPPYRFEVKIGAFWIMGSLDVCTI